MGCAGEPAPEGRGAALEPVSAGRDLRSGCQRARGCVPGLAALRHAGLSLSAGENKRVLLPGVRQRWRVQEATLNTWNMWQRPAWPRLGPRHRLGAWAGPGRLDTEDSLLHVSIRFPYSVRFGMVRTGSPPWALLSLPGQGSPGARRGRSLLGTPAAAPSTPVLTQPSGKASDAHSTSFPSKRPGWAHTVPASLHPFVPRVFPTRLPISP